MALNDVSKIFYESSFVTKLVIKYVKLILKIQIKQNICFILFIR